MKIVKISIGLRSSLLLPPFPAPIRLVGQHLVFVPVHQRLKFLSVMYAPTGQGHGHQAGQKTKLVIARGVHVFQINPSFAYSNEFCRGLDCETCCNQINPRPVLRRMDASLLSINTLTKFAV